MPAILTVQDVEKSFGTRRVLRGVSFAVDERDRIALVGVNGSGKSTLMRMMVASGTAGAVAEADEPDEGLITRRRGLRLEYVSQEPLLDLARTVEATLREAVPEEDQQYEVRGIASSLALAPMGAVIGNLSIGERRRVALARALLRRPELLALDEPTNHLDAKTVGWLEERLCALEGALLLVTHDRYFLDRVATRIFELDRGRVHTHGAGYGEFLERQAERLTIETGRERDRAMFVRRELDWIRRGPSARGTKQQARIQRFDAVVAARPQRDEKIGPAMALELPSGGRLGKTIVDLKGVTKRLGGKPLFEDLTLTMKPGDRIGIVGANGAGKTTLVRTILGELAPDAGQVVIGVNTKFAFLDQGRTALRDDLTVLQEVAGGNDHVFLESGPVHVRTFLRMMLFDDGFADTPIGTLSGGERNRVQLARLLRIGGNVLVLDEPTNDLDLITLGVLEEALVEFPGCALVVSHDRWFLDRVATGILAFEGDGRVEFFEGNYTSYLGKQRKAASAAAAAAATATATPASPTGARVKTAAPRRLTFKERAELDGIEAAIAAAEARVHELEQTLSDPSVFKDRGAEVPALVAALDGARVSVEQLYARWQELEAIPK